MWSTISSPGFATIRKKVMFPWMALNLLHLHQDWLIEQSWRSSLDLIQWSHSIQLALYSHHLNNHFTLKFKMDWKNTLPDSIPSPRYQDKISRNNAETLQVHGTDFTAISLATEDAFISLQCPVVNPSYWLLQHEWAMPEKLPEKELFHCWHNPNCLPAVWEDGWSLYYGDVDPLNDSFSMLHEAVICNDHIAIRSLCSRKDGKEIWHPASAILSGIFWN